MKKIIVSLPDGVVEILDKEVVGRVGEGYSDTLRNIILNWLGEQGYLAKGGIEQKKAKEAVAEMDGKTRGYVKDMPR